MKKIKKKLKKLIPGVIVLCLLFGSIGLIGYYNNSFETTDVHAAGGGGTSFVKNTKVTNLKGTGLHMTYNTVNGKDIFGNTKHLSHRSYHCTLTWNAVKGASGYEVKNSKFPNMILKTEATSKHWSLSTTYDLFNTITYYVRPYYISSSGNISYGAWQSVNVKHPYIGWGSDCRQHKNYLK